MNACTRYKRATRRAQTLVLIVISAVALHEGQVSAGSLATVVLLEPMPKPGWAFATAILNGKVHVLGGENSTCGQRRDHFVYDPDLQTWATAASMTQPRNIFKTVSLGGRIYAIAGNVACGAVETDQVEAYDPLYDSWSACGPLPKKLWSHAAAAFDGQIYVFGGTEQGDIPNRSVYIYNPAANTWSLGTDFPGIAGHTNAMPACSATVFGASIFMLGYEGNPGNYWLLSYSPANAAWASHGVIPMPFSTTWETPLVLVVNQRLAVLHNAEVAGYVHLQFYDPATAAWEAVDTSQLTYSGYNGVQAVSDGQGFYVLGGLGAAYTNRALYVTLSAAATPATNYFWVITKGRDTQTARAIYGLSPDGSNTTVLYQPGGLGSIQCITAPAVRADGRLVFHVSTSGDCGPLYAGSLNTDQLQPLAGTYLDTPCGSVAWIPGKDEVLFSNYASGVHRMDLDPVTADETCLTSGADDEVLFVTTQGTFYASGPPSPARMFTASVDGGNVSPWDPFNNGQADWAFVSADQRYVAIRQRLTPTGGSLTACQLDGTHVAGSPIPLVGGADVNLGTLGGGAWSPDGQTFCFQRDHDLWSINIDGSGLRQLTHGEYPFPQVWGARPVEPLELGIATDNGSAALSIAGPVGANVTLEYTTNLANPNAWTCWTSFTLPVSPFTIIDCGSSNAPQRFYRAFSR